MQLGQSGKQLRNTAVRTIKEAYYKALDIKSNFVLKAMKSSTCRPTTLNTQQEDPSDGAHEITPAL